MSNNLCSNVTGFNQSTDLANLVNNLVNIVSNLQISFNSVQSSISNLNIYDSNNDAQIINIQTLDGQQQSEISNLSNDDLSTLSLTVLEAKFPLTNSSILDGSIAESKITNLVSDLSNINSNLTSLQSQITILSTQESGDIATLTTNLAL